LLENYLEIILIAAIGQEAAISLILFSLTSFMPSVTRTLPSAPILKKSGYKETHCLLLE